MQDAVDRRPEARTETFHLAGKAGDRLSIQVIDVADAKNVLAQPVAVPDRHAPVAGRIDNAGIIHPLVRVVDLDTNAIERLLEANLIGTIRVTTAFWSHC